VSEDMVRDGNEGDFMLAIKVIYERDWFGYLGNDYFKGSSLKVYARCKKVKVSLT